LVEANRPFNETGLSQAARDWDKYSGRQAATFETLNVTVAEKNATVSVWVKEVLKNPQTTIKQMARCGTEYRLPDGRGNRISSGRTSEFTRSKVEQLIVENDLEIVFIDRSNCEYLLAQMRFKDVALCEINKAKGCDQMEIEML